MEKSRYIDVDELQAQTTLEEAAAKCGVTVDVRSRGKETRIDCPFGCPGDHAGRKEISVNVENRQKVFMCHAYSCGYRGNLMTLMHGWLTDGKPAAGTLRGHEFARVKKVLATESAASIPRSTSDKVSESASLPSTESASNLPLIESPDEKIRELHNIDEKFIVDMAAMSPAAASYVRRHPCLTVESMRKWRVGYMPQDGGGDKRGYSLRGNIVYPVLSETGQTLAFVGRDVLFEAKDHEFIRLSPVERAAKAQPAKHRFPAGFHRSTELYGQHASRLSEPEYRERIALLGIVVVEGFNSVIAMDNLAVPSVGVMSNRISEEQVSKVALWSRRLAGGKVAICFDADGAGDDGAKEALWLFAQHGLDARLVWSRSMHGGQFAGRQTEEITADEWQTVLLPGLLRSARPHD